MNIGIIIGRYGDIDGVSLETQKWVDVLQRMGHKIFILTGTLVRNPANKKLHYTILTSLSFFSPECEWEQKRAFFYPDDTPDALYEHLNKTSTDIAMKVFKWIVANKLNLIIPENASALPCHLSMGMALNKVISNTQIPVISHEHDFHWERGDRYSTPFTDMEKIINETFPLQHRHIQHAVINTAAQKSLKKQLNLDSVVVPNVMDFDVPYGQKDDYNSDMPKSLGLSKNDILLFQVTRIVRRKGIETAIDLVHRLGDKRIKLIITGSKADDERLGYYKELVDMIRDRKLHNQVYFGEHRIQHYRNNPRAKTKVYSLSDSYANSVATTYFSSYEGFGNAFVESVLAKKPIFVNNYKPVYWPDIGSKGFEAIMTEDNVLTDEHVEKVRKVITNSKLQREISEHNFELGKKYFSYNVLEELLTGLVENA